MLQVLATVPVSGSLSWILVRLSVGDGCHFVGAVVLPVLLCQ